jgi:hypothetical protein
MENENALPVKRPSVLYKYNRAKTFFSFWREYSTVLFVEIRCACYLCALDDDERVKKCTHVPLYILCGTLLRVHRICFSTRDKVYVVIRDSLIMSQVYLCLYVIHPSSHHLHLASHRRCCDNNTQRLIRFSSSQALLLLSFSLYTTLSFKRTL